MQDDDRQTRRLNNITRKMREYKIYLEARKRERILIFLRSTKHGIKALKVAKDWPMF